MTSSFDKTIIDQNDQLTGTQVLEFCTTIEKALKSELAPQIGKRIAGKSKEVSAILDVTPLQEKIDTMIASLDPLKTFAEFDTITQFSLIQILEKNKSYFEGLLQRYIEISGVNHQYTDHSNDPKDRFILDEKVNVTLDKLITTLKSVLPSTTQSSPETKESLTKPKFPFLITPELLKKKGNYPTYTQQYDGTYKDQDNQPVTPGDIGKQKIYILKFEDKKNKRQYHEVFARNYGIKELYEIFGVEYKECADTIEATSRLQTTLFAQYNNPEQYPDFANLFNEKDWFFKSSRDLRKLITFILKDKDSTYLPGYQGSGGGRGLAGFDLYLWLPVGVGGGPVYLWSNSGKSVFSLGFASFACPALSL